MSINIHTSIIFTHSLTYIYVRYNLYSSNKRWSFRSRGLVAGSLHDILSYSLWKERFHKFNLHLVKLAKWTSRLLCYSRHVFKFKIYGYIYFLKDMCVWNVIINHILALCSKGNSESIYFKNYKKHIIQVKWMPDH